MLASGMMIRPPICCATRGSLTRLLTMMPATQETSPTAGPSRKTAASHEGSRMTLASRGPSTMPASTTSSP